MRHSTADQAVPSTKKETVASWCRSPFQRLSVFLHRINRRDRMKPKDPLATPSNATIMKMNHLATGQQSVRIKRVLASSIRTIDVEPIPPVRQLNLSDSERSSLDSQT